MEALKDIMATTVGSAACVLVGQPFDTIKVRIQVLSGEYGGSSLDCIRKTLADEGVAALWKGYVPAFAGAVSENATAFVLNGVFHRLMGEEEGDSHARSPGKSFILGAAAGFFTAFVLCPTDVVKCREQVLRSQGKTRSTAHIARDLYQSAGWRGFTLGLGPQIWRDIAFFSFFFGSYDYFNVQLQEHTQLPTAVTYFISGGLAGKKREYYYAVTMHAMNDMILACLSELHCVYLTSILICISVVIHIYIYICA
jgi:hypothetical protein